MSKPVINATIASVLASLFLFVGETRADAVTDSIKEAMADCVMSNSSRIGFPVSDVNQWAKVVASSTSFSFSMIQVVGTENHGGLSEALIARTRETLTSLLEEKGYKGFRSETIETLEYCIPFALVAASDELERQENAFCPDDTGYRDQVEIVTASLTELRNRYGDNAESIRQRSPFMIELQFLEFSEIFRYGQDEHSAFTGQGAIEQVHAALNDIELENVAQIRPLVDQAMDGLTEVGEKSERMMSLERELICIKDWLDIYPAAAIARISDEN